MELSPEKGPGIPSLLHGQSGDFFHYKTTYQGSGVIVFSAFSDGRFNIVIS
jgi:hypothetical protein